MSATVDLRAILPSQEELDEMGRHRAQHPSVFRTESKRPEWYFRARVDVLVGPGQQGRVERTYYLGYCDEIGKKVAEKARDAILTEAINQPTLMLQSQVRFRDMIDAYKRDYLPSLREVSARGYASRLRHAVEEFGDLRMCDVTPQRVQAWANKLPAGQRRKIVGHLNLAWKAARAWGYTQMASPTEFCNFGQRPMPKPMGVLTHEQYAKLRAALPDPIGDMADVAVSTGLRISEIRGLPVRCVDLAAGTVRIEQRLDHLDNLETPKTRKGWRVLPLGALKDILRRAVAGKKANDLVFPAGCYSELWEKLKAAAVAVKCDSPGFGWHTLRRCHNTWLRKSGVTVEDRMDQMGHASAAVNEVYNIRDEEDFRRREQAIVRLQAAVIGQAMGPKQ